MNNNNCLFYKDVTEIYQGLILFCSEKGFKVNESNDKFYFLNAKKRSILFWRNLSLEFKIQTVEKKQVMVTITIYKMSKRQLELENKYIVEIEKFINKR